MMEPVMQPFEAHRPLLFSIAYRMLGSKAEAEDMVQEAFLRWQSAPRAEVESERAYLSTVVTRLCLDQLKSARAQRETYIGPWLPEPMRTEEPVDHESISLAFLVLLESLTPVERAVYLLHEVFDYSHAEVAAIVDKDEVACRQLFHRAKAHVTERRPRFAASREDHQRLLTQFLTAVTAGDLDGMRSMLAADATAWSDGGGKAAAARNPIHGADDIARFFAGLAKKMAPDMVPEVAEVNGWPALILRAPDGSAVNVLTIETDGERIYNIHSVANPDKLRAM
jgi:RNA polymerase sigma-70 factor, ECF subfamily